MKAKRVYGIDLGTTYSCIAHVDEHGKPVVLQNAEGDSTTPSVVYFESPSNIVVGQTAKDAAALFADQCVSTVKRAMGNSQWERSFFGQAYKPQDISSFILRKVVGDAENLIGEKIEDVVITCPAYFGLNEKEATKQAGVLAGLNVLYVIPEPTAAALAYGIEQSEDQVILVYDLGGGTFDITLIEIKSSEITVICTGGDRELGGKDWDDAIVSYFAQRFEEETGTSADSLLDDQETYQELLTAAERTKKALSSRQSVIEGLRFEGERVKVEVSREKFDEITAPYLERTLSLTEQELEKARSKGYSKIDKLLLVGGSTYMPQVIETVRRRFPFEIRQFDPNQAVAKGAALFGYKCYLDEEIKVRVAQETGQSTAELDLEKVDDSVIEKAQKEVAQDHGLTLPGLREMVNKKITNVTSKSFGVVVINRAEREVVDNLIQVDEAVPKKITKRYGTFAEGQIQVDLRCMENTFDRQEVELGDCTELGNTVLAFGRPMPQGSPIEVTFELGADGLLTLVGRDLTQGGQIDARFETRAIMSREEADVAKSRNLAMQVS
jgi:molecular chaperone DnaK (HSP70)